MAVTKFSNLTVTSGRTYNTFLAGNPAYVASSYESIATATGTGSSNTITFSSIPSTFKHLQIRINMREGATGAPVNLRFNGDTGSNYSLHYLSGDGTSATANGSASQTFTRIANYAGYAANQHAGAIVDILDYTSTSKYKTQRTSSGLDENGTGYIWVASGLWMSTSAISSLTIYTTGNFNNTSTFALYGIKEA